MFKKIATLILFFSGISVLILYKSDVIQLPNMDELWGNRFKASDKFNALNMETKRKVEDTVKLDVFDSIKFEMAASSKSMLIQDPLTPKFNFSFERNIADSLITNEIELERERLEK